MSALGCPLQVVGFTRVHPVSHCVHPWTLYSLVCALEFLWFIRGCWVHLGAPFGSLGSSGDVSFTRVRPGCRWVRLGSLSSLGCTLGVVGIVCSRWIRWGRWVHSFARWWSLFHPRSLGSLVCTLGVVGFIRGHWVHWGAPWGLLCSSGVVGFTGVCPGGRWFILGRWVHSGAPWGS